MSMINQMLKDLDARQAGAGESQPMFADVRVSTKAGWQLKTPVVLTALSVAAIGLGVFVGHRISRPSEPPMPTVVTPPPTVPPVAVATPTPAEPSPATAPAASPVAVNTTAPTPAATVAPESTPPAKTEAATAHKESPDSMDTKARSKEPLAKTAKETKSETDHVPVFKVMSSKQRSDNLYRQAVTLLQEGRVAEAQAALNNALSAASNNHDARQLLAGLLADSGRNDAAMALLQAGLGGVPGHTGFSMQLARLQLATGAKAEAIATLERAVGNAGDDADYHAFLAALLQTQGRHEESTRHYLVALRSNPSMPSWLVGIGISLQALHKTSDAAEAFQRALDTGELSAEVAEFASQQLKQTRLSR